MCLQPEAKKFLEEQREKFLNNDASLEVAEGFKTSKLIQVLFFILENSNPVRIIIKRVFTKALFFMTFLMMDCSNNALNK